MQVDGDEPAARLDVRDDRRARGDAVELVDRQVDPELVRDREQVQHAVRRAAGRRDRGDRILDRVTRDHLRRAACRRERAASRCVRLRTQRRASRDRSPARRSARQG